jgi:hypothetical protein
VCFGLGWIEQFLVWLVVICMVIALLRLLVAFVVPRLGLSAEIVTFVVKAITIVIWAIVLIACIYFIFDIIACALSGGVGLPRIR